MLGAGCQPMLPEGRMLQELGTGAGTAYCRAQLVWWDRHVPEGLGVLSLVSESATLSPFSVTTLQLIYLLHPSTFLKDKFNVA